MELQTAIQEELVSALPVREAITVQSTTVVHAAVQRMREKQIGCAVIVDPNGNPIGIFTERSLVKMLVHEKSLDHWPVGDFADDGYLMVKLSDPISVVWDAIQRHGYRFLIVTDDDGKLTGVTGQRGVAEFVSDYFPGQVHVQRFGSTPWMQEREGA